MNLPLESRPRRTEAQPSPRRRGEQSGLVDDRQFRAAAGGGGRGRFRNWAMDFALTPGSSLVYATLSSLDFGLGPWALAIGLLLINFEFYK